MLLKKMICLATGHKWFATVGVQDFRENWRQRADIECCIFREHLCTRCGEELVQYIETLWSWDPVYPGWGGPTFEEALAEHNCEYETFYFPLEGL